MAKQHHNDDIERLKTALHDAITRPAGVVPDSALEFYEPERCKQLQVTADAVTTQQQETTMILHPYK